VKIKQGKYFRNCHLERL